MKAMRIRAKQRRAKQSRNRKQSRLHAGACVLQDPWENGDLPALIAAARAQSRPTVYGKMARLQAGSPVPLIPYST